MTTDNKTLALDVLNEMERASERLFDAGLHRDLSLDVARDAVAELIEEHQLLLEAVKHLPATDGRVIGLIPLIGRSEAALARVKGESA